MPENMIEVIELSKTYQVPVRREGLGSSLSSLLHRKYDSVSAVQQISFSVTCGEMVGLIGPNGAGKTTTLKMLSGLLHPSAGKAQVAGFIPWNRDHQYLRQISMVMGNKSQMLWDIPPLDSFRILSEIYQVPKQEYRKTLDELVDLLNMKELLTKPVRNLSLGERMKCELAASLLYRPAVLFLDEPTLGLDVSMQIRLRRFLKEYNQRSGVTVLLTSHYMADVMALCPRVILIHHGKLIYDGDLKGLAKQLAPFKLLRINLQEDKVNGDYNLPNDVEVLELTPNNLTLRVPRLLAPTLTARLLNELPVADLTVEDPPIEAVIDQIYSGSEV